LVASDAGDVAIVGPWSFDRTRGMEQGRKLANEGYERVAVPIRR
jgi:hypothetical protein